MENEQEFEEKPIPLIAEGFDLENDGIEFLQKLSDKNIAVISIIGPAASGKSFLANQLSGKINKGFEIGSIEHRKECCTKGIWIWGKPIIKDNYYIIILDAQGFRTDTDENLEYSQKIFALCSLISSVVIYNYKKDDDSEEITKISNEVMEHSYELFNKLIPFLEKIKLEDNDELGDDVNKITQFHLPEYIWLYRDYKVNDFDPYNDLITKINENNTYFNQLFKNKINNYSLPCPMDGNQMLVNAYLDIDEEEIKKGGPFSEEYKTSFNNFKNIIIKNCKPKIINNLSLNGNLFYGLLQEYASAIFSGEYMFVESPLTNVFFSNLGEITEGITENFKEKLEEKNKDVYDIIQQVKNSFEIFSDGLLNDYHNTFIGKLLHSQFMTEEMNNILSSVSDELLDTNINEKLTQCNDAIKELTEKEAGEKILKIESVPDIKKNLNTLSSNIKKNLEETIFKKENEFLSTFNLIKDYITKCICDKINLYADSINFYIDHNLQTIESSSKSNEAALEAKIQELNKKESEIIEMNVKIEKLERDMKAKEDEFKELMETEKLNIEKLKKNNDYLIEEKNKIIKNLENKCDGLNKELKSYFNSNDELTKIKNENLELKVNLGKKEKQLNSTKAQLKELDEKKLKDKNSQEINLSSLKNEDLPKLKEIFKVINKTISEYSDKINQLEQNKEMVFHDKFIEFSKSTLKKICKNWNEELSQFKEEHFKTMVNNYCKEIFELKKDNNKLVNELELLYAEINQKNIEILKLNEKIKMDQEIFGIKEEEIKSIQSKYDTVQKELEIYKVRLNDKENVINNIQIEYGLYKGKANMIEDEYDNIVQLLESMYRKDKRGYNLVINKIGNEIKELLNAMVKTYGIFK